MAVCRPEPGLWGLCCAGVELQGASGRHNQEIAQIGMPRSAKMSMAETDDGRVVILVPCAVFINIRIILAIYRIRDCIRIRTELHCPEGNRSTGEGVSHIGGTDKRLIIIDQAIGRMSDIMLSTYRIRLPT